jgi:hypothetical protein
MDLVQRARKRWRRQQRNRTPQPLEDRLMLMGSSNGGDWGCLMKTSCSDILI